VPPPGGTGLSTAVVAPAMIFRVDRVSEMAEETAAVIAARVAGIDVDVVRTDRPSTAEESARWQGIALRQLLRSIVVRRGTEDYLFVLVPGGRQIDWTKLRAALGVSRLSLPTQDEAQAATGYERGAITPFGAATPWPVIVDVTALDESRVAIGGGARGVNLHLGPKDLVAATGATVADVTKPDQPR
jgi:Cys-tRNA(Pro)/Cys-tRNA(Cys) deacylase